jgi:MFS family permease
MKEQNENKDSNNFKFVLRALKSRNYRLYFSGQSVSLIGTWMQQLAMSWLIYKLSNSAFLLGLVGFTAQIPSFFLMPFAVVLVDKWNRRRILLATQSLFLIQALAITILTLTQLIANNVILRYLDEVGQK